MFFWTFASGLLCFIACICFDIKNWLAKKKKASENAEDDGAQDDEEEEEQFSYVGSALDWRSILKFSPAAILWGLADISEVLALGKLDPVLYAVLLQQRLMGTAIVSTFALKVRYSLLQWTILTVLVLLVIAFSIGS